MRSSASVACHSTSGVSCSVSSSSIRDQRRTPKHRARYKRSQAATDFPSRRIGYFRGVFQVVKDCITNTSRVRRKSRPRSEVHTSASVCHASDVSHSRCSSKLSGLSPSFLDLTYLDLSERMMTSSSTYSRLPVLGFVP